MPPPRLWWRWPSTATRAAPRSSTPTGRSPTGRCGAARRASPPACRAAGAGPGVTVGVLARNDRSFVDALLGASKTGADIVLLNTGFAGPQLADVVAAEGVSIVVHDGSFAEQAADVAGADVIDGDALRAMATSGDRTTPVRHQGRIVILTSGTTGRPKGATRGGGGANALEGAAGILERIRSARATSRSCRRRCSTPGACPT